MQPLGGDRRVRVMTARPVDAIPPVVDHADEVTFDAFVSRQQASLRRFALTLTGDQATADDLVQATLVKIFLAWPRLSGRDSLGGYARTTMSRTYISWWRRWGRREVPHADLPEVGFLPAESTRDDRLWRAIAGLGRRQRAVIVLRYYEDLDLAAIAATLDVSIGTVKSQLSRARQHLRAALAEEEL